MTTGEKVARRKLSLLELAAELGNVSKACRVMGYGRQQFYEIRRNYQTYGTEGLLDRLPGPRQPHPNRVAAEVGGHFALQPALSHARLPTRGPGAGTARGNRQVHRLNNDVLPVFEQHQTPIDTMLSDKSNGFVERLHRTLLDEHFRIKGREKWYESADEMQSDLDAYLAIYNTKRPHQGRGMNGKTPVVMFAKGLPKKSKTRKTKEVAEAA